MKLYLHQFLTRTGCFKSKQEVYDAISKGEIRVDDKIINNKLYQVKPGKRKICWGGRVIECAPDKTYIILNKPAGFLSSRLSKKDIELGKKSVFTLLAKDKSLGEKTLNSLFCVGRLDEDSSGMLILTNDGAFCSRITDPKYGVEKTYSVVLESPISSDDVKRLGEGVVIALEENGKVRKYKTKGCRVCFEGKSRDNPSVTVSEGKKREVRRMFQALGGKVLLLERTAIGGLKLKDLKVKPGFYVLSSKDFLDNSIFRNKC